MSERHFVEFLEAAYALDRDDEEWLTRALLALSAVCGREHNYVGFFYDASDVEDLKTWNECRLQQCPQELAGVWEVLGAITSPTFVRATFRSKLLGSARRDAFDYLEPLLSERERNGHGDVFCLNGLDASGEGCLLTVGCRQPEFSPRGEQGVLLRRMVTHLSAAYRCRRRLSEAKAAPTRNGLASGTEAVLDASGRVVHAEGAAQSRLAREQLQAAVTTMDAARAPSRRYQGVEALDAWRPLLAARWTLVDSFEESGRRYVIARENQSDVTGFDAFTDRERQVVFHAALGLTNKEVAYTLGISHATVRVLMARAARRLQVRSRAELLAHPALRGLRAPDEAEPAPDTVREH